ncbi:hypothetical protein [uncultured Microbulbifer sp.]|uniref:hypothetical protein n=1 Tax=uncultured Microbulbifer sp. TaxID=348147 RepID=UPI00260A3102|nr:hypothetical protein [uncultured Microbulbifer sp.]
MPIFITPGARENCHFLFKSAGYRGTLYRRLRQKITGQHHHFSGVEIALESNASICDASLGFIPGER